MRRYNLSNNLVIFLIIVVFEKAIYLKKNTLNSQILSSPPSDLRLK